MRRRFSRSVILLNMCGIAGLVGREDLNLQIYQLLTLELSQRQFIDR